jgi:basic membrane lipoprotein Med (substrate-binding protein (PBP1-ABC) superfamily)
MFIPLIEDAMSGNWKGNGELVFYNIGEGVDIGVWGENVPQDVVDQVEAVRAKMISGKLDPFVGPWVDKNGIEVLPAGETLTDWEWTLGADYVLAGIEGAVGE